MFTASAWRGHYYVMVPLAWALQSAGHDVRVACTPDHAAPVAAAGLVPVPVLDCLDMQTVQRMTNYLAIEAQGTHSQLPLHPYTGEPVASLEEFDIHAEAPEFWQRLNDAIAHSYDGAVRFARAWRPDLVLHDLMTPEGALVAELLGVQAVYHPPGLFGTAETEPGVDLGDGDPSESFPRYGLEPWHNSRITHVIDPSPDTAVPPMGSAHRLSMRYLPYNGPTVVPDWVHEPPRRPRVCVLWGASSQAEATEVPALQAAVEAALSKGAEVWFTAGPAGASVLGGLAEHVRVLQDFPLHLLLTGSSAIIHHGSVNCLLTAATRGVPQLALALSDEQATVSGRIAATGAALSLRGLSATPEQAAAGTIAVLTEPAYHDAAHRLRSVIAGQPSPADLVPVLEGLALKGSLP
ncbi:nucleotide disphospho-sugar-binding domain-containing protein [Kitasatospora sp. NBC_01302]|uniref:nucleotide disphospho-sugar-binding domain-containing protein n=1 Tax=Kitasatospora sp. NBC_01302 TaxID=2903575 RepID=UPI002E10D28C